MNYYYNFDQIKECFNQFYVSNNLKETSLNFFYNEFFPILLNYINNKEPIFNYFKRRPEGIKKETYIFDDWVIKFTNLFEIQKEELRKIHSGCNEKSFLDSYIIKLPKIIQNNYNNQLILKYIDCIVLQKKVTTLTKDIIQDIKSNFTLNINQNWLIQFLKDNYKNEEANLIIKFLSDLDYGNGNIGYDEKNNPIMFDW